MLSAFNDRLTLSKRGRAWVTQILGSARILHVTASTAALAADTAALLVDRHHGDAAVSFSKSLWSVGGVQEDLGNIKHSHFDEMTFVRVSIRVLQAILVGASWAQHLGRRRNISWGTIPELSIHT